MLNSVILMIRQEKRWLATDWICFGI